MSLDIWTRCAVTSEGARPPWSRFSFAPFRVVESQHVIATRKLVDSDDEQALLESLIDQVKPPVPSGMKKLHYLLATPFRHPPLRWGSRFGTTEEPSLWYGSRALPTAFAEVAYYRLLFLDGTRAALGPVSVELTSFRAQISTRKGIDLCSGPFAEHVDRIANKRSYADTHALGRAMRAAGVEAFTFPSARDPQRGANVALFVPCFSKSTPFDLRTWLSTTTAERVEISRKDLLAAKRERFAFERALFEVEGTLPSGAA
jgi:hypothetical protein